MSDAPSRGNDTLLALGILGATGLAAYQFWYLPYEANRILQADIARRRAAQPGLTQSDALAQIASIGCVAYGAVYKLPPQVTGQICSTLGQAAANIVRSLPGVATNILKEPVHIVGGAIKEVAKPVKAVGNFFSHLF